jgi:hypothetical protein
MEGELYGALEEATPQPVHLALRLGIWNEKLIILEIFGVDVNTSFKTYEY